MDIVDDTIAAYRHAQDRPDEFHGLGPFSVETGKANGSGPKPLSYTEVFG